MTNTQRKRDPRYTRTVGEKPNRGRRYVENGKVRIEWYEAGKRRSRTIGHNSAEARREADEELERLLGLTETDAASDEELDEERLVHGVDRFIDDLRGHAEVLLDFADDLAESFEKGLVRILSVFARSAPADGVEDSAGDRDEAVDAEVVEQVDDADATHKTE